VFLDGGLEAATRLILREFRDALGELGTIPSLENPKGELQEMLQSSSNEAPQYQLECVFGPDHDRVFVSAVTHRGVELGRGKGKSKKEAESQAARAALSALPAAKEPTSRDLPQPTGALSPPNPIDRPED
jgi:ribonuclease-3